MDQAISDAVDLIYRASLEPALWPDALDAVAKALHAKGAFLFWGDLERGLKTLSSNTLAGLLDEYRSHWWRHDVRNQRVVERGLLFAGVPVIDEDLLSPQEIEASSYYNDFLQPKGFKWFIAAPVMNRPKLPVILSVQRAVDAAPFQQDNKQIIELFARHVERALLVSMELIEARELGAAANEALGRHPRAVFMVDDEARITYSNDRGRAILGDGLLIRGATLAAADARADVRLREAIRLVSGDVPQRAPRPFSVRRSGGRTPLAVYVLPFTNHTPGVPDLFRRSAAIVIGIDPDDEFDVRPDELQALFQLTPGESRIAAMICQGLSTADVAARCDIAEDSVRTTLKQVFRKVGVKRQSELILRVARITLARGG